MNCGHLSREYFHWKNNEEFKKQRKKIHNHSKTESLTAHGHITAILLVHHQCLADIAPQWFWARTLDRPARHAHGVLVTHAFRALALPGFTDLLEWRSDVSATWDSPRGRLKVAALTFMGLPLGPVQPWTVQTDVSGNEWQTDSFCIWFFFR